MAKLNANPSRLGEFILADKINYAYIISEVWGGRLCYFYTVTGSRYGSRTFPLPTKTLANARGFPEGQDLGITSQDVIWDQERAAGAKKSYFSMFPP